MTAESAAAVHERATVIELGKLDLNLLVALYALLSERNVSRAASSVGLSQPSMSRALRRLRARTGLYDFCVVAYSALDTPATPLRLNHSEPNNVNSWVGIRDPEIDAMIEESERITDREAQIQKVKDIQLELLKKYAHMGQNYTPISRELRWAYLQDWDETTSTAWPVHTNYQTQAWLDL